MATRRRASNTSITGAVSDLQRRVRYLQAHTPPSRLSNQVVARTNIRPRAVDSDQIALQAVTNDQVAFDAIQQANLANNSVGRNEIIDGEVVRTKIGTGAVDADRLDTDAVTNSKIQNSAVTTAKLQNSSVSAEKIGTSAVTVEKIRDGAVARSKIQDRAVGTGQIADSAIESTQIATNAVSSSKLQSNSVTSTKIVDRSVTGAKIATNTILLENLNGLTPIGIVQNGLQAGTGLVRGGGGNQDITLSANFGSGITQIARGNHTHSLSTSFALSGLNRHQHSGNTGTPSTTAVKKDITTYNPENIKNLLQLQPKQYKYKRSHRANQESTNREWMHGYLIEDLLALGFSEPVFYDAEGNPEALDYSLMSLLVLELVKTQQAEIDSLKEEVLKLKDGK